MADVNKDGEISLQELATALKLVVNETSDEAQEVIDAFGNIIDTLAKDEGALASHGETVHDKAGE